MIPEPPTPANAKRTLLRQFKFRSICFYCAANQRLYLGWNTANFCAELATCQLCGKKEMNVREIMTA
jgi:hypothetical protein